LVSEPFIPQYLLVWLSSRCHVDSR
jgi:hypothetical protein